MKTPSQRHDVLASAIAVSTWARLSRQAEVRLSSTADALLGALTAMAHQRQRQRGPASHRGGDEGGAQGSPAAETISLAGAVSSTPL